MRIEDIPNGVTVGRDPRVVSKLEIVANKVLEEVRASACRDAVDSVIRACLGEVSFILEKKSVSVSEERQQKAKLADANCQTTERYEGNTKIIWVTVAQEGLGG